MWSKMSDLEPAKLEDFKTIRIVGQGSYGKVYLVSHSKQSDQRYAMKIIRKDLLIDQKKIQQAYIEKEILYTVNFI